MKPSHQRVYATILWHIHRSKDRPKKRWSIHRKTRNIWIERIIKSSSQPGDLVDDPFLGSLPTAVIVEKLYRRRLRVEKSEEYVKLTRERLL